MSTRTIVCEDCGQSYETARANTKYCRVCRLARNLAFLGETTHECFVCEQTYAPIERQTKKWRLCGGCSPTPLKGERSGTCALCRQGDAKLIHTDIAVCRKCAFDPEQRPLFFKALLRKQRERRGEL